PVRLRGLPRGVAAAGGGGGGGAGAGRAAVPVPLLGVVEWQQREHRGLVLLGLAARGRRAHLGCGLLPGPTAEGGGRGGPNAALLARLALLRLAGARPAGRWARHQTHLVRLEPARLHGLPRLRAAVRGGVRLS